MLIKLLWKYLFLCFLLYDVESFQNFTFCKLINNPVPIDLQLNRKLEIENQIFKTSRQNISSFQQNNANENPIRIKFEYTGEFNRYSKAESIKNEYIAPAQNKLQELLGVKYIQNGPLRVPRYCPRYVYIHDQIYCEEKCSDFNCGGLVPEYLYADCEYFDNNTPKTRTGGPGAPDTDLVIMVTYDGCQDALAKASSCARGLKGRPILGKLIICEKFLEGKIFNPQMKINVIIHEIFHILAFSADNMLYFVNSNGEPIIPLNDFGRPKESIIDAGIIILSQRKRASVATKYSKRFLTLNTSKAKSYVRSHFQCNNLNGVDLEDENGNMPGHIDELVYGTEIMTPVGDGATPLVLSGLSLSILDDSGWYNINYIHAETLVYGANLGCQFALDGCYNYMVNKNYTFITPFCKTVTNSDIFCSRNQQFMAYCDLHQTNLNNAKYIYFKHLDGVKDRYIGRYSGSSIFNEYCPTLKAFIYIDYNSECTNLKNRKTVSSGFYIKNYYGSDSKCLNNLINPPPMNLLYGGNCFKIRPKDKESFVFIYNYKEYICRYYTIVTIVDVSRDILIDCGPKSPTEVYETIHDKNIRERKISIILRPMNFILMINILLIL